jgi:hypothetical protein
MNTGKLIDRQESGVTNNRPARLVLMTLCSAADAVLVLALLGLWGDLRLPLLLVAVVIELLVIAVAIGTRISANIPFFGSAFIFSLVLLGIGVSMWFVSITSIAALDFDTRQNPIIGVLAIAPAFYFSQVGLLCFWAILVGRPPAQMGVRRFYARLSEPVFRSEEPPRGE